MPQSPRERSTIGIVCWLRRCVLLSSRPCNYTVEVGVIDAVVAKPGDAFEFPAPTISSDREIFELSNAVSRQSLMDKIFLFISLKDVLYFLDFYHEIFPLFDGLPVTNMS